MSGAVLDNEDFIALEALLIERLQGNVKTADGAPFDVMSYAEVLAAGKTDSDEPVLRANTLVVHYHGYRRGSGPESPNRAIVEQIWSVSVAVANVRDRARAGARSDAGPALTQVFKLLHGWLPPVQEGTPKFKRLVLTDQAFAPVYRAKNSYFPLSFTSERPVEGTGNT